MPTTRNAINFPTLTSAGSIDIFPRELVGSINFDVSPTYFNYQAYYAQAANLVLDSITTIVVTPGIVKSLAADTNIVNPGYLSLNITTSGANGLDTGSVAANKIYSIYLISDSGNVNPVASLASLSVSNIPTVMPAGYDRYRRIGWWQTLNDSSLAIFKQVGTYNLRRYFYVGPQAAMGSGGYTILTAGSATSATDIDVGAYLPINCSTVGLQVLFTPNGANQYCKIKNADFTDYNNFIYGQVAGAVSSNQIFMTPSVNRKFIYLNSDASCSTTIDLNYYEDEI